MDIILYLISGKVPRWSRCYVVMIDPSQEMGVNMAYANASYKRGKANRHSACYDDIYVVISKGRLGIRWSAKLTSLTLLLRPRLPPSGR